MADENKKTITKEELNDILPIKPVWNFKIEEPVIQGVLFSNTVLSLTLLDICGGLKPIFLLKSRFNSWGYYLSEMGYNLTFTLYNNDLRNILENYGYAPNSYQPEINFKIQVAGINGIYDTHVSSIKESINVFINLTEDSNIIRFDFSDLQNSLSGEGDYIWLHMIDCQFLDI